MRGRIIGRLACEWGVYMQTIDIEQLMKNNPHLDLKELEAGQKLGKELDRAGLTGPGYDPATPVERHKARVISFDPDVRTVNLTR